MLNQLMMPHEMHDAQPTARSTEDARATMLYI